MRVEGRNVSDDLKATLMSRLSGSETRASG